MIHLSADIKKIADKLTVTPSPLTPLSLIGDASTHPQNYQLTAIERTFCVHSVCSPKNPMTIELIDFITNR